MDVTLSKTRKLFSASNVVGYLLGLLGLSAFAVTQFLSALMPLLFAPMVCAVLGLVLYKSQVGQKSSNAFDIKSNAVPEQSV
jgi:multisubunit Na+/H+ antiporter MnhG subunit